MHVLFLPSWYPAHPDDVAGSFFREQALALKNIGAKVGVVAPALRTMKRPVSALRDARRVSVDYEDDFPTYRGHVPHLTPWQWQMTSLRFGKVALRMFDDYIVRNGRPDMLHVHAALPAGGAAIAIKKRHRIPFVLSEHSSSLARGRLNSTGVRQMRNVIEMASASHAVSSPFAKLLENSLGLNEGTCRVMPNSVSANFMDRKIETENGSCFRFCHISSMDANKNVAELLHAFARGFRKDKTVSLVIGGDGPSRSALQNLSRELGITSQVEFAGALSRKQVLDVLARSDAFILPSHFETFGVVLIEATAMGLPVIATRCGGPEDIVTEENGILVPTHDTPALAEAMQRIYETRESWDRQRIRDDCRERFGADTLARKWLQIYRACANQQEIRE